MGKDSSRRGKSGKNRMVCLVLLVPGFRLLVHRRLEPGDSIALMNGDRIVEATDPAIVSGMKRGAALAAVPEVRLLPLDPELYEREGKVVRERLFALSGRVAMRRPGDFAMMLPLRLVNKKGSSRLLDEAVACAGDYPCCVGLAATEAVARVAARAGVGKSLGRTFVKPGEETAFLGPLPLGLLDPPGFLQESLALLGIASCGAFAAMPAACVRSRFGSEGWKFHRMVRGLFPEAPIPDVVSRELPAATQILEAPIAGLPAVSWFVKNLLVELLEEMRRGRLAATVLELALELDSGKRWRCEASFPSPTRSARLIEEAVMRRVAAGVAAQEIDAAVTAISLRVLSAKLVVERQMRLFGAARGNGQLDEVAVRLRERLGPLGAVRARLLPSRRPETSFRLEAFREQGGAREANGAGFLPEPETAGWGFPKALRLVEPPRPMKILFRSGRPREALLPLGPGQPKRVRVALLQGPERLSGEWWMEGYARDYFQMTAGDGGRYWIFRDLEKQDQWRLHGIFD